MCGEYKADEEFYVDRRIASGRDSRCKTCCRLRGKAYNKLPEHRARALETRRAWNAAKENWPAIILYSAKARAKKQGIEFSLTTEDVVIPERCPVLGIVLSKSQKSRTDNSPSIDRIDSSKGYVRGNVAIISDRANRIKNDGNAAEHQLIADWIRRQNVA